MWGNTGKKLRFGMPDQLAMRQQIENGELIWTDDLYRWSGHGRLARFPSLDAEVFDTPEAARRSVAWQAGQGYDFIKVYDHLSPEVYQAIIETAAE